jgi:hypothetical protein
VEERTGGKHLFLPIYTRIDPDEKVVRTKETPNGHPRYVLGLQKIASFTQSSLTKSHTTALFSQPNHVVGNSLSRKSIGGK